MGSPRARRYARYALAGIRLVSGTAALLAPVLLLRRLGVDPGSNPAAKISRHLQRVCQRLSHPSSCAGVMPR